ncbi:peptide MFS transporter [Flexithrix dorotheae]|uniref:peptide MFS transporter n=1 Tax=Flexithrix dorotheae TaxID=70993 RepID=UPI00037C2DC5|nr:peptide MFS transporter [Flexithrix dorotheae]
MENQVPQQREFLGHPVGLYILFFTELWERFSYYGMRAILVLYIVAGVKEGPLGGMGWSNADALALYGWYTMLVYVMSVPGGILADKFLGQKKSVMLGGWLLVIGHGILAVEADWAFFTGLAFIILGVGCLKPNISTMVGGLYKKGDIRRDKGFTIFYIGINIGAFLSPIFVGYVGERIGWHYGFGLAGIGMFIGQLVFLYGQKYLKGIGDFIPTEINSENAGSGILSKIFKDVLATIVMVLLIGLGGVMTFYGSIGGGILVVFGGIAVGAGIVIFKELNDIEKDRVTVLLLSFLIVIVFWGAFEQAGGLMNIYAKDKINRMFFSWEIPASIFQSVNSFFIITLGTAVAGYWVVRRLKGKEESAIFKMSIGTIIMGLGFLCMAAASLEAGAEPFGKGAMIWLILAYLFHTVGELSLSPVSLSFITKLAPARYVAIMMGVYWAATGLGNKMAGAIGEASQMESVKMEMVATNEQINKFVAPEAIEKKEDFSVRAKLFLEGDEIVLKDLEKDEPINSLISLDTENEERLITLLKEEQLTAAQNGHATLKFDFDEEEDKYNGEIIVEEIQNQRELKTFLLITLFTVLFGLLLLAFLRKLKKMTHGAEDVDFSIGNVKPMRPKKQKI